MKLFSMEILYMIHSPVVYKNVQLGLLAFGSEIVTFSWLKRKEKYESKMHALLSHVFINKRLQIFYVNILWIFQVICKSTRGFLIHTWISSASVNPNTRELWTRKMYFSVFNLSSHELSKTVLISYFCSAIWSARYLGRPKLTRYPDASPSHRVKV